MPQAALAEDVELVQAEVLGLQQAELHHGEALGRAVQRAVGGDGRLAHQDAADVDAELVRHADDAPRVAHHGAGHAVRLAAAHQLAGAPTAVVAAALAERIDLGGRQAERLAQLAHRAAPLEGGIGGHLRRVEVRHAAGRAVGAVVLAKNVAEHLVAVLPAEIDVEVGRLLAGRADEALEVEVQLDGVHVGDAQAIGHQAVGTAAAPHVEEAAALRMAHDVVVDEEVADEAHAFDHLQLVRQARRHLGRGGRVAAAQALARQAVQRFAVGGGAAAEDLRRLVAAIEGDAALLQQAFGVAHQAGVVAVEAAHLPRRAELLVGRGQFLRRHLAQQRVAGHGAQQAVRVEGHRAWHLRKGDRQPSHQLFRLPHPRAERQARQLRRAHADVFVGLQRAQRRGERQDEEGIRCPPRLRSE